MILKYANLRNMWDVEITEYLYANKNFTEVDSIPYIKTKMTCTVMSEHNEKQSTANPTDFIPFVPGYFVKSFVYNFVTGHFRVWVFDKNDTTLNDPEFYERILTYNELIDFFKDGGNDY